jgi:peptidoglycan-N-acetylglucosamine deacetylase
MLMVHPRSGWGSGTPARARIMEDMIRYIKGHAGVRFFTVGGLARWCLDNRQYFD